MLTKPAPNFIVKLASTELYSLINKAIWGEWAQTLSTSASQWRRDLEIKPSKQTVLFHSIRGLDRAITRLHMGVTMLHGYTHSQHIKKCGPACSYCGQPETKEHVLLLCPEFLEERRELANQIGQQNLTLKGLLNPPARCRTLIYQQLGNYISQIQYTSKV